MIYACCGLPRCGKSTFTQKLVEFRPRHVIVSGDSIRLALTNERYNAQAEGTVHSIKDVMMKALIITGHHIVYDGTNTTIDSVRKLEKIAKQYNQDMMWFIFDVDKEICKERAIKTEQSDLLPVIEKMATQLNETRQYILDNHPYRIIKDNNDTIIH